MQTYDVKNVTISVGGATIDGFGPDAVVKVSRNEDGFSFQPSNSGGGARSKNPNKSGRIEITLLAASPSNAILQAFAVADELRGEGVVEALIKDRSTALALCQAQNAWVVKFPDWERGKTVGDITWILECDDIEMIHDGLTDVAT
jgi:hypothetical protein